MARCVTLLYLAAVLVCSGCANEDEPNFKHDASAAANDVKTAAPMVPIETASKVDSAGKTIFVQYCSGCHDSGDGHPGTMRLAVRLGSENSVLRHRTDLAPEYVKIVVRNGFEMMPAFRPTEIHDTELDALAEYVSAGYKAP